MKQWNIEFNSVYQAIVYVKVVGEVNLINENEDEDGLSEVMSHKLQKLEEYMVNVE